MNRRQFLQTGLMTGLTLAGSQTLIACSDMPTIAIATTNTQIHPDMDITLSALLPILLEGALATETNLRQTQLNTTIKNIHTAISQFPPHIQAELHLLFELLSSQLALFVLCGHWATIDKLTMINKINLLTQLRESYLAVLNTVFVGLKELVYAGFYSQPEHWQSINYQKPNLGVSL